MVSGPTGKAANPVMIVTPAAKFFLCLATTVLLVAGLAACGGGGEKSEKPPSPEVSVMTIRPTRLPVVWHFVGQTKGYRTVEIRARVEGVVRKIAYTEGSFVEKGTVLFKLDPTEYEVAVAQQKGQVAQAKASLEQAKRTLARVKPLYKSGAVSGQQYDETVSKVQIAEANLQAATAQLQAAQINLDYTTIEAPISGLSEEANISLGSLVTATQQTPLTTIIQTDPIYVYFSLADKDFLTFSNAVEAGVIVPPEDNKYRVNLKLSDGSIFAQVGRLDFKNNIVDPNTGTVQLRAVFPNPQGQLVPNQFVRVSVSGAARPHAILVPQRAVLQNADGYYVFVVNEQNKVETKPVKAGAWEGTDWLIEKGLDAGDRVIVDGFMRLRPGMQVQIKQNKPSPAAPSGSVAAPAAGGFS